MQHVSGDRVQYGIQKMNARHAQHNEWLAGGDDTSNDLLYITIAG